MQIYKAHRQWADRPPDERFTSLDDLYNQTRAYADASAEAIVPFASLRTEAQEGDVILVGRENRPAKLTHWAFGQMASRAGAPANYLRSLPATLAVQNLNYGLKQRESAEGAEPSRKAPNANLLLQTNGGGGPYGYVCRSLTTEVYTRIWNYEVAERLRGLEGWEPARPDAAPTADPALYASDHDMFAFMRHSQHTISEPGNPDGLRRGVIVENSEVGSGSLKLTRFLYRMMCGNHIVWGAEEVSDIRIRHVGYARDRMQDWSIALTRYANSSPSDEEATITRAKQKVIAATKEAVLDSLFSNRRLHLSRTLLEAGYDAVVPDQDGSPNTVWGIVQGLTRHSQTVPYADDRTAIDRAAGRVLRLVAF